MAKILDDKFLSQKLIFYNFFKIKLSNFSSKMINPKRATPEEIREVVRQMRVENHIFDFKKNENFLIWTNNNEAMRVYVNYTKEFSIINNSYYFENPILFEDLKNLLANIPPFNNLTENTDDYFFSKISKILRTIYLDNFKNIEFFDQNIKYGLRCFNFLKNITECEYLMKNSHFIEDLFEIIRKCSDLLVEQLYISNKDIFIRNLNLLEDFFNKFLIISDSKHIAAFNPLFFYTKKNFFISKILSNFENLVLFYCVEANPKAAEEKLLNLMNKISHNKFESPKIIDYINIYLIKNLGKLNIFFIIDMANLLSSFNKCVNFEILFHLNDKINQEIKSNNIFNFPKDYLVMIIRIFDKNSTLDNFVIIEKLVNILINKCTQDFDLQDISIIVRSIIKSRISDKKLIDYFLNIIVSNNYLDHFSITKMKIIQGILNRFIGEAYENDKFFRYIFQSIDKKLNELNVFNNENFDNKEFTEYMKNEMIIARETISLDLINRDTFIAYYNDCQLTIVHCLFKLYKNYEFIEFKSIIFEEIDKFDEIDPLEKKKFIHEINLL